MNKCSYCGQEFEGNFCPRCGKSVYVPPTPGYAYQGQIQENQQPEQKNKGLTVLSIVLLVAGILMFWIPLFGLILCIVSLIIAIVAKSKRKPKGKGLIACIVISALLIPLALATTAAPFLPDSGQTNVNSGTSNSGNDNLTIEEAKKKFSDSEIRSLAGKALYDQVKKQFSSSDIDPDSCKYTINKIDKSGTNDLYIYVYGRLVLYNKFGKVSEKSLQYDSFTVKIDVSTKWTYCTISKS
ncbi:MAG: DUF308 domain-containing protein [Clostridia bacterium]|nr:DUF308 domain-containing protein [Clostridia bacterium]MBQ3870833.1 DUF308 domain-containing protein [Clostridia bacterium]